MQPAQFERDLVQVGDDVIAGQGQMLGDVGGQRAIAAAGQQLGGAADPSVAVQRHGHVDVVEELRQSRGFPAKKACGRQVVRIAVGMPDQVHRGAGRLGGALGDHIGHLFQAAAMDRQEAEARPQPAGLDHLVLR